jgi:branched-chain amino acid aminotransferase
MIRAWHITSKQTKQIELPDRSSLDSITRQLPDGFYSTFRTYARGTRVIGLKAHLQRLYQPVRSPEADEATLREQLRLLLKAYPNEARVRVIMTKQGQLYLAVEPLKPLPREVYENGVHVETIELSRESPRLKSTAFISASQGERKHIAHKGIFEALMVRNGKISEGMTSNFFYILRPAKSQRFAGERSEERMLRRVKSKGEFQEESIYSRNTRFDWGIGEHSPSAPGEDGGILCTAQREILLGVTRRTVIRVARGIGLKVKYQPLKRDQLQTACEAFITSSSRGIVPVVQIDEVTVGEGRVGAITRQLSAAYEAYVLEKAEEM